MIITRELDYALRILRALSGGKQISATQIEAKEKIPVAFVRKIVRKLRDNGIVTITRGVHGGYVLTKSLDELTIWDVSLCLGEQIYVNECMKPGYDCKANPCEACSVHSECHRIQEALKAEMSRKTLMEILV